MIFPTIPQNEASRIQELINLEILDTYAEEEYDKITSLASEVFDAPIALVSLIDSDRQWFKSKRGLDAVQTPRELAFCAHAINNPDEVFVVNDATKDERFLDNPLVTQDPNVIFYAGMPIKMSSGNAMGTICVIDNKPRTDIGPDKIKILEFLAGQVERLLELRKETLMLERANKKLQFQTESFERFSKIASHELRSPLNNISLMINLFEDRLSSNMNMMSKKYLDEIRKSSEQLTGLIKGLGNYSRDIGTEEQMKKEHVQLKDLIKYVVSSFESTYPDIEFVFNSSTIDFFIDRTSLQLILSNLISNACRFNTNDKPHVEIICEELDENVMILVNDNGPGISEEIENRMFELFQVGNNEATDEKSSSGIGLAVVEALVLKMKGSIGVESSAEGTSMKLVLPKK